MKDNPYVGPRPFERGDRHNFFGRNREARELRALIVSEREVLFYAQSGAGKTSLLNAVVIPALEEKGFHVLPLARVGSELPPEIHPADVENIFVFSALLTLVGEDADPRALLLHTLSSFLSDSYTPQEMPPRPLVLIFDQFEEIFTTHRGRWQDAQEFFEQVRAALEALPHLGVVFAMREDYVAEVDPYVPLFPRRLRARFRMERLGVQGALAAVTKPALNAGCAFDAGVAERLVDDLRRIKSRQAAFPRERSRILGPYVEPVQLQVVCRRLWEALPEQQDRAIQWEEVEQYGNVDRALTDFYESAVTAAMQRTGVSETELRRWFGHHLITPMSTRGLAMRGPKRTADLPNEAVDILEAKHLIRAEVRAGARWYELAHDRLVDPILQSNRIWEAAHETPLRTTARRWRETQDDALLYRGQTLTEAQASAKADPVALEPYELEFLEASQRAERARIQRRRQRIGITIGLTVGLVMMAVLALIAFRGWRKAEAAQALAERQERIAQAGQLAAQSQAVLEGAPQRSLLLAIEALNVTTSVGEMPVSNAKNALGQALARAGGIPLTGSESYVHDVTFSPDGRWLATASWDGAVRLWSVEDPSADPQVLRGHENRVMDIAFSPDGEWLASAGGDHLVWLWSVNDPRTKSVILHGHEDLVWSLAFSPDGRWLATASQDTTVRVWDVRNPQAEPMVLRGHGDTVRAVAFSPDGRWLVTASLDATARLWDLSSENGSDGSTPQAILLEGHTDAIVVADFSPDGRWLATGSWDSTVRLWDMYAPEAESLVLGDQAAMDIVTAMAFSPDGGWLAVGSGDHDVRLWQVSEAGLPPMTLKGHEDIIESMAFSPDGKWLATGSWDNTVRLWHTERLLAEPVVLLSHEEVVRAVAFSPDGQWLATGSWDSMARLWKVSSPTEQPKVFRGHLGAVAALAVSPDGRWLATGGHDYTARLWDVEDPARESILLQGHTELIQTLAFSPDGEWLATGGLDATARLWDVSTVVETGNGDSVSSVELYGHQDMVYDLEFSPDGRWLATGSWDGTVRLWDLAAVDHVESVVLPGYGAAIKAVAFSPDGRWLAAGGDDGVVRVWLVEDPMVNPILLEGHADIVIDLAFSPDGRWLATGSYDTTVRLWSVEDWDAEPAVLHGHTDYVTALAFSPDGYWLATGSFDYTARLWGLGDLAAQPIVLYGHEDPIRTLAFSSAGYWLATTSGDETTRLWDVGQMIVEKGETVEPVVLYGHTKPVVDVAFSPDDRWVATASGDGTARLWILNLVELTEPACQLVGRNLTFEEWKWYFSTKQYSQTCPNLPHHPSYVREQISQAEFLVRDGEIQAASALYEDIIRLVDGTEDSHLYDLICLKGSLDGLAETVLPACEQAVELEPYNELYRDNRGLARALTGNYTGAIEDFTFVVEFWRAKALPQYEPFILDRETWIAELEARRNPFDEETLDGIKVLGY